MSKIDSLTEVNFTWMQVAMEYRERDRHSCGGEHSEFIVIPFLKN